MFIEVELGGLLNPVESIQALHGLEQRTVTNLFPMCLIYLFFFFFNQVWQEISVEAKHVKDIMKTLESFKLDNTPLKASQQELPAHDAEVWSLPVPAERR